MKQIMKIIYQMLILLTGVLVTNCNNTAPDDYPSGPYPDAGPDISVIPTAMPDTVVPTNEWIIIDEGDFEMGMIGNDSRCPEDALPVHSVHLTKKIAIMRYQVTAKQFRQFVEANKDKVTMPEEPFWGWEDWQGRSREDFPVVNITWKEAKAFAEWIGGRLPTEAEWEYCARAHTTNKYAGDKTIDNVAIYYDDKNTIVDTVTVFTQAEKEVVRIGRMPRKVGSTKVSGKKASNDWNIFDMSGNVMEWCNDWYSDDYYELCQRGVAPNADTYPAPRDTIAINPKGPDTGMFKILRGGGWNSSADFCTVYIRLRLSPGTRSDEIGFRVVRDL